MALDLIGRHRRAVRESDVRAAVDAIALHGLVHSFAIGKIRRVKHGRAAGTVEVKALVPQGLRITAYAPNIIVQGVGR
jgi:hypothetical protein